MDNISQPQPQRSKLKRLKQIFLRRPKNREQLLNLLRDAEQRELLDAQALAMIEGVLQVSELQVRDIMIPRAQMIVVQHDAPLEKLLPQIIESGHSRFPVIGESRDEVLGILLAKDLLRYHANANHYQIRDILRSVIFVPESKPLNVLLQEFRSKHNHMAIVVDEYGGAAGLVTIEDVLEQIVGDIDDEYDIDDETYIRKHSETHYILKALTPIADFNEYFGTQLSDEEFDTIGGLVTHAFGHLPKRGENTVFNNFRFKVLHADKRRLHLLHLTKLPVSE